MKLTDEVLEKLILEEMEALDEKSLPNVKYAKSDDGIAVLRSKLGFAGSPTGIGGTTNKIKANIRKLANAGGAPTSLSDKDLRVAAKAGTGDLYNLNHWFADNSTQTKVKDAANAAEAWATAEKAEQLLKAAAKVAAKAKDAEAIEQLKKLKDKTAAEIQAGVENVMAKFQDIEDINVDAQAYEPKSIAFGSLANIGSQVSDPNGNSVGKYPEGIASAMQSFLGGLGSFNERIEKISKFSKTVFEESQITGFPATKVLAGSLVTDYISTIATEVDAGAAAYNFESLLAMMAGGVVTGKGSGDSSGSGPMGAVDFVMKGGMKGSSKYYASIGKGKITQAVSGFAGKRPVLYIIAHKKEVTSGDDLSSVTKGTADAEKILAVNIYLVTVTPLVDAPTKAKHFVLHINGTQEDDKVLAGGYDKGKEGTEKTSGTSLDISAGIVASKVAPVVLYLRQSETNTFKQNLEKATGKSDAQIKGAYAKFQEVFKQLYKANQKAQRYASGGETKEGNAALAAMTEADTNLSGLAAELQVLSGEPDRDKAVMDKAADIQQTRKITENEKLTEEILDKLIKAVIL